MPAPKRARIESPRFAYNLVDSPFIPCVCERGELKEWTLREALVKSHEIIVIRDSSPLITVALHRLLLAILHRNFGPSSFHVWKDLWTKGKWSEAELENYFAKCRPAFDLFNTERPFYQVPREQLEKENSERHPVAKLAQELASGNNSTLFDHRSDEESVPMTPAEAARYLVAFQNFHIGFGKSQPFYFSDAPLVRGLIVLVHGKNLFETLALNMVDYSEDRPIPRTEEDEPAWEQKAPAKPEKQGTHPRGYLDYLTWQSRRVCLLPERSLTGSKVVVRYCLFRQNLKLGEPKPDDPMKCYEERKDRGRTPLGLRPDRAVWRDCESLFQLTDKSRKRPDVFNRVAKAKANGILPSDCVVSVIGFATEPGKAASVILWRHEELPLPLPYLEDIVLLNSLKVALALAEDVGRLFETRPVTLPGREKPEFSPVRLIAEWLSEKKDAGELVDSLAPARHYWSRLEGHFLRLLQDLPGMEVAGSDEQYAHREREIVAWSGWLRRTAWTVWRDATRAVGTSPRALRAVNKAENSFRFQLGQILPKGVCKRERTD